MRLTVSIGTMMVFAVFTSAMSAQKGPDIVSATLTGDGEVPLVSTGASGSFFAEIDDEGGAVDWTLTFSNLEGTVTQSHIHVGQPFVAGGISVWLCKTESTAANAPAGTQDCPQSGTISGTFTASDIIGPAVQGITGETRFKELIAAMREGNAYANVHSNPSLPGEIRGQIKSGAGQ
jgi:hypothetical protein